ncbi:hypothetical protein R84B8_01515 [Treponema sp. R8-4-B8]
MDSKKQKIDFGLHRYTFIIEYNFGVQHAE